MDEGGVLRSMVRDDAYRVVRVLGEGPGGRTELVTLDGEELLVRKRMPAQLGNAAAWASLMGSNEQRLPRIESLYQTPDELVVVYAYVAGQSVRELVAQEGRLVPPRAASLVEDVCHAVSALHALGLVHRDIAPGNVIVAEDGAHLVDLGIARRHVEGREHDTMALGTWGFAAPEQFGFAQTDARSDVYAIGRLLGYLLTGEEPGTEEYNRLLADPFAVPPGLAGVVNKASAFEPSARYQSADELGKAVRAALYGTEVPERDEHVKAAESQDVPVATATREVRTRGPRPFGSVPIYLRVATVIIWGLLALWVVLVIVVSFDSVTKGTPPWGPPQYAIGVCTCGFAVAVAWELYSALVLRDTYARTDHPVRHLLWRICIIALVTFVAMFAVAAIFATPSG